MAYVQGCDGLEALHLEALAPAVHLELAGQS